MELLTTTIARKNLSQLVTRVSRENLVLGVGRRNRVEALIIKYPATLNRSLSSVGNFNAYSASFDFLHEEPDLYSSGDLRRRYV